MILALSVMSLLPVAASAVFLWLAFNGRFSAPKFCPKCGADLKESDRA